MLWITIPAFITLTVIAFLAAETLSEKAIIILAALCIIALTR